MGAAACNRAGEDLDSSDGALQLVLLQETAAGAAPIAADDATAHHAHASEYYESTTRTAGTTHAAVATSRCRHRAACLWDVHPFQGLGCQ